MHAKERRLTSHRMDRGVVRIGEHWHKGGGAGENCNQAGFTATSLLAHLPSWWRDPTVDWRGLANFGECKGCTEDAACLHVAVRQQTAEGRPGVIWAAEGAKLMGKKVRVRNCMPVVLTVPGSCPLTPPVFLDRHLLRRAFHVQIMHRGQLRVGEVCEFDHVETRHTVEWEEPTPSKARRSIGGSRTEETRTSVDSARDDVREYLGFVSPRP